MWTNLYDRPGWRDYQAKLQREARFKRLKISIIVAVGFVAGLTGLIFSLMWIGDRTTQPEPVEPPRGNQSVPSDELDRRKVAALIAPATGDGVKLSDYMTLESQGVNYTVKTTIEPKLQAYVNGLLQRSKTLQAAVVVLNPFDGRVLAMSSHDSNGGGVNLCLKASFPAASLFKIVSAAAAVEAAGLTPDKALYFNGSRHTLYRSQLKQQRGRYTNETQLRKAFAASNNSVFGKLGIHVLGRQTLTDYAAKFYFNRPIPFDMPVGVSVIDVPEDDFGLAEIASGFNKRTRLSPLHAALMACAVANKGSVAVPWLVDTVSDASQKVLYKAQNGKLIHFVETKTAAELKEMMADTVTYGTGRRALRKLRRHKLFKDFALGAKTGTINDVTDRFKYDWTTAFAVAPHGDKGICVGVLAVHGEKLGVRATELTRAIIDYSFRS